MKLQSSCLDYGTNIAPSDYQHWQSCMLAHRNLLAAAALVEAADAYQRDIDWCARPARRSLPPEQRQKFCEFLQR
jgi:hypothetical protein